jgi:predicted nucleic acid-binding protein
MRLVFDTDIALAGLLSRGAPGALLDAASNGRVRLFSK